ncbi:ABC transporter ATP-binding protein [Paenibacillus sp. 1001270B_150601_E10]|uniref:ABC transporter ATP-binding protein n=1 Tax=Paenibacillus sp. 1001270B_150601_E10 TaxID=2787079 RepID=UPI00189FCCE3|nr:ABC transporter ATP-binding protein [Paenibacillus sp. 1001270B_150601_E10]
MEHAITMTGVDMQYPGFKLDNLSLTLPTGTIMGLIGENGAGKSTTIKLILDLISRNKGDIRVLGQDNRALTKPMKEHIGVVLEECTFPDTLTPNHINRILKNIFQTWNEDQFHAYIKRFHVPADKKVKELSRGMKMKLSIAAALSHDSKLLILDEATSGLDPIVRDEMLDVFLDFMKDESHSILMSSHILSDLEKVSDYIAFMHQGKLLFSEEKDMLLDRYGVLKCTKEDLARIDPSLIQGVRQHQFGAEALVERSSLPGAWTVERATIEDIMIFFAKENGR